jgi:hypothetical protein
VLKAIQESNELPSIRFQKFRTDAVPAIEKYSAGIVGSAVHTDLCDGAAGMLRGISLTAWNDHQDMTTAVAANELALKYVRSAEIREQLIVDQTTLRGVATQRAAQRKSSNMKSAGCFVVLAIIGLVVFISSFSSNKSSVSTPRSTPPASPSPNDEGIYRVPKSQTAELNRDRQTVEAAKARAEQYSTQLESLSKEIERDRGYLNGNSRVAVDDYNAKLQRYRH